MTTKIFVLIKEGIKRFFIQKKVINCRVAGCRNPKKWAKIKDLSRIDGFYEDQKLNFLCVIFIKIRKL
jgi:hypothetical protein